MSYSWTVELHLAPSIQMKDRGILNGEVNRGVPRNVHSQQKLLYVNYSVMVYKYIYKH